MDPKSEQKAEEAASKPPNDLNSTVKLNVGGVLFEVSRSLIEANEFSMIAALVSERWNEDAQTTIFIDRDGEKFRHCLQFLRNGCVDLPLTISRDEFLRDMDYYGLDWKEHQVTEGAAVMKCVHKCVQNAMEEIQTLTKEASYARLAKNTFEKFVETGRLSICYESSDEKEEYEWCRHMEHNAENQEEFNRRLQQYGLNLMKMTASHSYLLLGLRTL